MNLRDFQYIIAVAKHQSFTAAANQCAISQPTLSTQIKKLEDYLNISIFDRQNNEVVPTPVGMKIIHIAKNITQETEKIKQIAKASNSEEQNNMVLGAFPTLASYVFPEYVFHLKQHLPDINLRLIEEKTDSLIELLITEKLDMALLALPIDNPQLESQPLFKDEFYVAVAPNHRLANSNLLDIEALKDEKLMLLDEGHCLRSQIIKLCTSHKQNEDNFRAASLETLRVMVKSNIGITLMPSVAIYPNEHDIRYIPLNSKPNRTIGLFWLKNNPRADFFKKVVNLINYKPVQ